LFNLNVATPRALVSRAGTSSLPLSTATKLSESAATAAGAAPVVAKRANSTSTVKEILFIFIFLSSDKCCREVIVENPVSNRFVTYSLLSELG
jgi:hypothetical protein